MFLLCCMVGALLAAYVFLVYMPGGFLDNIVLYSSVDVLKGWLDSFSFWLPQCWGLPVMQSGVFPQLLLV